MRIVATRTSGADGSWYRAVLFHRCLDLARETLDAGDGRFGSVLVEPTGAVLFA